MRAQGQLYQSLAEEFSSEDVEIMNIGDSREQEESLTVPRKDVTSLPFSSREDTFNIIAITS